MNIPTTPGGWCTICADPPWPYAQRLRPEDGARGGAVKHYPTMTVEEIAALPVERILASDAQVWLWTTTTHLHEAFHVLDSWGLTYRTARVWVKKRINGPLQLGLGYWLRGASEYLLLGTRGNPRARLRGPHGATGLSLSTVLIAPKGRHSEKPAQAYRDIEAMSEPPRLEMFARRSSAGWTACGDEVVKDAEEE